jgi:hypothetical protein
LKTIWTKVKFALEGDENAKFFHASATCKLRRSTITSLTVDGVDTSDHAGKDNILKSFFSNLLGTVSTTSWRFDLPSLYPDAPSLSTCLSVPFTQQEIREAFSSMNKSSSPGPDGFGAFFFQTYWEIIKDDVSNAVLEFFNTNCIMPNFNSNTVVLIPKVQDADTIS